MSAAVLWLVAAGIPAAGEMDTLALFLGMFAVGVLAAAEVAFAGGGLVFQAIAFAGTSAVLAVPLRPVARRLRLRLRLRHRHRHRLRHSPQALATDVDAVEHRPSLRCVTSSAG